MEFLYVFIVEEGHMIQNNTTLRYRLLFILYIFFPNYEERSE
jgi:hypothetical protein